jgi:hypothetical protein
VVERLPNPDGRRILHSDLAAREWRLLDGHTMAEVAGQVHDLDAPVRAGFHDATRFWLQWTRRPGARSATRPSSERFELRDAETGALLATMPVPPGLLAAYSSAFALTDDAGAWALLAAPARVSAAGWTGQTLRVTETASGRVLLSRDGCTSDWGWAAFPGRPARVLAGDLAHGGLAVFGPPHAQPLAVLPGTAPLVSQSVAQVSPDGRTILTRTNPGPAALPIATSVLTVYRPTGWDCPESGFGAMAFPQTWLTGALVALLAFSLTADARRARRQHARRPVSSWLIGGLLLITIPLTTHALLAALLGHWIHTPAPALLLLAVVLATHARAWRGVAIVALCGLIPLLAWYGYGLRRAGLASSVSFRPLDRFYDVPVRLPLAAVGVLGVLVMAGLYLLLRPRAHAA